MVGGAIAEGIAWQWIFWLNVPIALLVVALAPGRIAESVGSDSGVDLRGLALVTGAALAAAWALVRAHAAGWRSIEVITAFAVAIVLTAAFVHWELRAREPMVPMRLFRSRSFSSGNAAGFFLYASLYGTLFFMAQFLQTAQGYGPLGAGLRLLPWTATLFVIAPIAGALVNRVGERALIVGGLLLQAIGLGWIALIAAPGLAYVWLAAPLIVAGVGVSMAMPAAQNCVLGAVGKHEIGKASGTFNMLRFLGGAFGIAVLVALFAAVGGVGSAQSFSDGFAVAIGISAALSFLGAVAGIGLPGRRTIALVPARSPA